MYVVKIIDISQQVCNRPGKKVEIEGVEKTQPKSPKIMEPTLKIS